MDFEDIVGLLTLITVALTLFAQLLQSYFDYKRDMLNKQDDLYKSYSCNCCVVIEESSE